MSWLREKYRILPSRGDCRGTVVMIHGLFVGSFIMSRPARFFRERGRRVVLYDYPTMRRTLPEHCAALAVFLNDSRFDDCPRIDFVTHSMGGLLLRGTVPLLSPARRKQLGRAVLIAPPNRGSDVAARAVKLLPPVRRLIVPISDLSSADHSFANTCPVPPDMPETGIIAASHDHQVRLEYTSLRDFPRIVLPGSHTGILFRRETSEQAWSFITHGSFLSR